MPSFAMGIALGLLLYFIGKELYGNTFQNWYAYIGRSYNIPKIISAQDKRILFMIIGATGMLFSPIGEEFFFRGVVHGGFTKSIGERKASYVDSLAFAVTHIAHFGLLFLNDKWIFYFVPTVIWVVGMFVVSLVFFQMKRVAESLLGAVLCHAGFNLGMIYSIFYLL
ncbi:MAG: CPBP family intramembrane glutamic endopeptidase [Bacteroidota bacterium]